MTQHLPDGVALRDGQLEGVPSGPGSYSFLVRIVDRSGQSIEQEFRIDIRPTGMTSAKFVTRAREEARLVFQPGTIGGGAGEGFIRGALTKGSPEFEEGLERFKTFVRKLL